MKLDPYYQRLRCKTMTLLSRNIRYMQILARVPQLDGVKQDWGGKTSCFLALWVDTSKWYELGLRPTVQSYLGRISYYWTNLCCFTKTRISSMKRNTECPPTISVTHFASPGVPLDDPGLALTFVFARFSLHISCVQTLHIIIQACEIRQHFPEIIGKIVIFS